MVSVVCGVVVVGCDDECRVRVEPMGRRMEHGAECGVSIKT